VSPSTTTCPIYVKDIGKVTLGPALRRGALDKEGAEAVGGVVVVRYGFNPLGGDQEHQGARSRRSRPACPRRPSWTTAGQRRGGGRRRRRASSAFVEGELNEDAWVRWLRSNASGSLAGVGHHQPGDVVPFYDRTGLIYETLGTLNTALVQQILVTIIVVLVMVLHLRSSLLIGSPCCRWRC
jgi:copper/silver efflux system protein